MKYLLLCLTFFLFATPQVLAVETTPPVEPTTKATPKPTEKEQSMDILNDLKDKIASRVAQLNLVEKRGLIGKIDRISGTQITIVDGKDNNRFIDVDELTKFSAPSAKDTFGLSDLTKGNTISILGLYNKQSRRLLARFIDVITLPKEIHGVITNVDSTNFTITIISNGEKQTLVDVENITKTLLYNPTDGLTKVGFSKIGTGVHVIVIGFPEKKDPNKILASRILLFPNVPKDPRIIIPQEALDPNQETVVSSGSGNKLTPIK